MFEISITIIDLDLNKIIHVRDYEVTDFFRFIYEIFDDSEFNINYIHYMKEDSNE